MSRNFFRSLTGKNRDSRTDFQLGLTLALIAGAINAGGFLAVAFYTSHMTGIVSSIADYIVLNKFASALIAFLYLLSFIFGAIVSTIIINWAKARHLNSQFALAIMLESYLLLFFGLFAVNITHDFGLAVSLTVALLCFIMGLQNAIITKVSNYNIRTTHVTGLVTDIGIEIGRFLYSRGMHDDSIPVRGMKLRVNLSLLFSFILGGIIGALLFQKIGFTATIPFSILLAVLAIVPIFDDLSSLHKKRKERKRE